MGCSLSEGQERLLAAKCERVIVMLDGDAPGQEAASECWRDWDPGCGCGFANVPDGKQPDQLPGEELRQLLVSL
jgi:DNA primase